MQAIVGLSSNIIMLNPFPKSACKMKKSHSVELCLIFMTFIGDNFFIYFGHETIETFPHGFLDTKLQLYIFHLVGGQWQTKSVFYRILDNSKIV